MLTSLWGMGPLGMARGIAVAYLLRDEFSNRARAAGAVNGTAANPGPGTRTVVDTESKLSLANHSLVLSGGKATPAFGDPRVSYASIVRTPGRMFTARIAYSGGTWLFGFGAAVTATPWGGLFYLTPTTISVRLQSTIVVAPALVAGKIYDFAVVLRTTGAFFFVRENVYVDWTLLFVSNIDNETPLYPLASNLSATASIASLCVPDALWSPSPVASDSFNRANGALGNTDGAGHTEANGGGGLAWAGSIGTWAIATNKAAASALTGGIAISTLDVGAADVECDAFLARSAGALGVVLRYVDSSNYVRCYHNGTNILLDKVVAGTVTNVATVANATNNQLMQVRAAATKFRIYYNGAAIGTEYTIADAALQSGTRHGIYTTDTGNTFDYMAVWPVTHASYAALESYMSSGPIQRLFSLGDSKTEGDTWPAFLCQNLNVARGQSIYYEHATSFGVSGATAATLRTYVAANLAAVTGSAALITFNLGANDVNVALVEATWKADYIAMIDAVRAKWPTAHVYIARAWRRGEAADCNTLATWIADIVAGYPSGVHLGMDERVWLEGGDDGATMTVDGIHYSTAGETAAAAAWAAVIAS